MYLYGKIFAVIDIVTCMHMHICMYTVLANRTLSRMSLILHEVKKKPKPSVNIKYILQV